MKALSLISFFVVLTSGIYSSSNQDPSRIKNRHDVPDTVRDSVKIQNGGALIDTINLKSKPLLVKPDSTDSIPGKKPKS